jgi:hypothetical protein
VNVRSRNEGVAPPVSLGRMAEEIAAAIQFNIEVSR